MTDTESSNYRPSLQETTKKEGIMTLSTSPTPTPAQRTEWWYKEVWLRWLQKHAKRVAADYSKWVMYHLEESLMPVVMMTALSVISAIVATRVESKIIAASIGLAWYSHASYYVMYDMAQEQAYRKFARMSFWASSIVLFAISAGMMITTLALWIIR